MSSPLLTVETDDDTIDNLDRNNKVILGSTHYLWYSSFFRKTRN